MLFLEILKENEKRWIEWNADDQGLSPLSVFSWLRENHLSSSNLNA